MAIVFRWGAIWGIPTDNQNFKEFWALRVLEESVVTGEVFCINIRDEINKQKEEDCNQWGYHFWKVGVSTGREKGSGKRLKFSPALWWGRMGSELTSVMEAKVTVEADITKEGREILTSIRVIQWIPHRNTHREIQENVTGQQYQSASQLC